MSGLKRILNELTPPILKKAKRNLWKRIKPASESRPDRQQVHKTIVVSRGNPKSLCYVAGDPIFKVPVARLRYPDGRGYTHEEHHFLQYYNSGLDTFRRYYQKHLPKNLYEFFGIDSPKIKNVEDCDLPAFPWLDETGLDSHCGEHGLSREEGNQAFGPVSEKKLYLEAARLDQVLKSIRNHGFRAEIGGYVRGYFMLRSNGEWVFVIREGFHRTAALVHLRFSAIDVQFAGKCPRSIEEVDSGEWPMVKNGLVSERAALAMFSRFFEHKNS